MKEEGLSRVESGRMPYGGEWHDHHAPESSTEAMGSLGPIWRINKWSEETTGETSEVKKWKARLSLILHFFTSSLLAALWRFVLKALLTPFHSLSCHIQFR